MDRLDMMLARKPAIRPEPTLLEDISRVISRSEYQAEANARIAAEKEVANLKEELALIHQVFHDATVNNIDEQNAEHNLRLTYLLDEINKLTQDNQALQQTSQQRIAEVNTALQQANNALTQARAESDLLRQEVALHKDMLAKKPPIEKPAKPIVMPPIIPNPPKPVSVRFNIERDSTGKMSAVVGQEI